MMINTVIAMEKYSQGGVEYSCFVYVFCIYLVSKKEILLCIGLMLCDSGQKYD